MITRLYTIISTTALYDGLLRGQSSTGVPEEGDVDDDSEEGYLFDSEGYALYDKDGYALDCL